MLLAKMKPAQIKITEIWKVYEKQLERVEDLNSYCRIQKKKKIKCTWYRYQFKFFHINIF